MSNEGVRKAHRDARRKHRIEQQARAKAGSKRVIASLCGCRCHVGTTPHPDGPCACKTLTSFLNGRVPK